MDTKEVKKKIAPVFKKHHVVAASIFGSVARGEANAKSDVDLVVRVGRLPFGIWGFVALKQDLEKSLGRKVDIISEKALNPKLKRNIKPDLISIYEGKVA